MDITVYSWLKNADLHAISAQEALVDLMHQRDVASVYRLKKWVLDVASESDLHAILDQTYYVINPNKEAYSIHALPHYIQSLKHPYYILETSPNSGTENAPLAQKIQSKTGVPIAHLHCSLVWIVAFKNTVPTPEEFELKIAKTTSHQNGILVNPLYETTRSIQCIQN